MNDTEILEKLLEIAKERKNIPLPLGYVVDSLWGCLKKIDENLPKGISAEATATFILNTALMSLLVSFVSLGNEKEMKRVISDFFKDNKVEFIHHAAKEKTKKC